MIIYKATNNINGKSYVGQTINSLDKRKKEHIKHSESKNKKGYFQRALKKHKPENFKWEVVCECNDIEDLDIKEIYYIKYYNTFENGYNMTLGGNKIKPIKFKQMSCFYLSTDQKKRLEIFCDKNKTSYSKVMRNAIDEYINEHNYKRNEDLEKLVEGIKDEPIVTEPFELPEEKPEIPKNMTQLKVIIPTKLINQINCCIEIYGSNLNNFCAKSFKKYMVYLERK